MMVSRLLVKYAPGHRSDLLGIGCLCRESSPSWFQDNFRLDWGGRRIALVLKPRLNGGPAMESGTTRIHPVGGAGCRRSRPLYFYGPAYLPAGDRKLRRFPW